MHLRDPNPTMVSNLYTERLKMTPLRLSSYPVISNSKHEP